METRAVRFVRHSGAREMTFARFVIGPRARMVTSGVVFKVSIRKETADKISERAIFHGLKREFALHF